MGTVDTTDRLRQLRALMQEHKFDVYIVPSADSHQSEYIAPCDARREYISGFSGSAGTAVITLDRAALATDGRYFNQASKQLDGNWELLKQGLDDVPTWQDWTASQSEGEKTVGVDSTVITAADARRLADKILKKSGGELIGLSTNLIDQIWGNNRPARPNEKVRVLDLQFSGKKFEEKVEDLREELEKKNSAGLVISMLDEVAWLFNLRGNDIPYNPVFFSYAVVTPSAATLYVDSNKFRPEVISHLGDSVHVRPYEAIFEDVEMMSKSLGAEVTMNIDAHGYANGHANGFVNGYTDGYSNGDPNGATNGDIDGTPKGTHDGNHRQQVRVKKFMVSNKASWALHQFLGGVDKVEEIRSPVGDAKAIKNETELEGMRQCHLRDGAALSEYFAWLEEELVFKGTKLDEVEGADMLAQIRSKNQYFAGLSFDTISSTGANAAVIHYKPERGFCATIDPKAIYLCDSGAQYLDGTTDTTRTLHFGEPTEMERKAYTLVLKGVIALDKAVFPQGTHGLALDTLARQFLWEEGLDYRHGTGHGVGSYLNVHEGPIGIGTAVQYTEVPLSVGNVLSDEPGYYEDGNFGIRIENIIMARTVTPTHHFGGKPWLGFEHVTMVPLCRKLIDVSLLTPRETRWLNAYHAEIWEKTKVFFENDAGEGKGDRSGKERTKRWLMKECAAL